MQLKSNNYDIFSSKYVKNINTKCDKSYSSNRTQRQRKRTTTRSMKSTNQKQELPMAAMFVNGSELNQHSL